MIRHNSILSLISVSLLFSCTVLEDRTECPAYLILDCNEVGAVALKNAGLDSLHIAISSVNGIETASLNLDVHSYVSAVGRGPVSATVWASSESMNVDSRGVWIDSEMEFPEFYSFSCSRELHSNQWKVPVKLNKNWCTVNVSLKQSSDFKPSTFILGLYGSFCGVDLAGKPLPGKYSCRSDEVYDGKCSLRVPRQADDSLSMIIFFEDGAYVRSFPLGDYLRESGYDWTAEKLEDVNLELDFSTSGVSISISQWVKHLDFELTI